MTSEKGSHRKERIYSRGEMFKSLLVEWMRKVCHGKERKLSGRRDDQKFIDRNNSDKSK